MVTNNFIYLSVTSGPVSGRHTMSVHEGRGPQDGIYVLGRVAQVHINSALKTRHTCVFPVRSPEEHILNERGTRKSGILKEVNRNRFHPTSDKLQILQVIM